MHGIARLEDGVWSPLGGEPFHDVQAITVFDDGDGPKLYVAGTSTLLNDFQVYRRDGQAWTAIATSFDGSFTSLAVFALPGQGPKLYVAGYQSALYGPSYVKGKVLGWDGTTWTGVDSTPSIGQVQCLAGFESGANSALCAAVTNQLLAWNGSGWTNIGDFNGPIRVLTPHLDTDGPALYVGGGFQTVNSLACNCVARWNGTTWNALGPGIAATSASVWDLSFAPGADPQTLWAGGAFSMAGGAPASNIATWNGSAWSAVSPGLDGPVYGVATLNAPAGAGVHAIGTFQKSTAGVGSYFIARLAAPGQASVVGPASTLEGAASAPVALHVQASGAGPLSYQWRLNGQVLTDGTAAGGGGLAGTTTPDLAFGSLAPLDAGLYDCVVTGACGSVSSAACSLTVHCFSDFDDDTFVNGVDFDSFVAAFVAGDPTADVDHDGFVTGVDFDTFVEHFVAGC